MNKKWLTQSGLGWVFGLITAIIIILGKNGVLPLVLAIPIAVIVFVLGCFTIYKLRN